MEVVHFVDDFCRFELLFKQINQHKQTEECHFLIRRWFDCADLVLMMLDTSVVFICKT